MTRDPVCGMSVDPDKAAFSSSYNANQFYFCNKACKTAFDDNPLSYIKKRGLFARFLDWIIKGNEKTFHYHPPNCCGH